jgi:gamma-glutamyltranspeptidase/glutathione hydrolase
MKPPSLNLGILCCLALLLVGDRVPAQSQREEPSNTDKQAMRWQLLRPVVRGTRGAIGAGTPLVTETAMRVFHAKGNAVDAGVAAMFASAVSEFSHFGFGGEAPLLIRTPDGKVHSIAGIGAAPKRMTREFFLSRRSDPEHLQESQRRARGAGPIPASG